MVAGSIEQTTVSGERYCASELLTWDRAFHVFSRIGRGASVGLTGFEGPAAGGANDGDAGGGGEVYAFGEEVDAIGVAGNYSRLERGS